jgi:tRNA pseudouridine38-40 synthase
LIEKIEEETPFFHPTLDSRSKEYHYRVSTSCFLSPFKTRTHWHFPYILDETLMKKGALNLIGKKDFKAFTNHKKNPHRDTIREVFSIDIVQEGSMVRNIVGTLCYIGCHKLPSDCIERLINQKLRMQAGVTAPACGLVLKSIQYA